MGRIPSTVVLRVGLILGVGIFMGWPGLASSQDLAAMNAQGPRFLTIPAPNMAPVAVDVHQHVLLRKVVSLNLGRSDIGKALKSVAQQTGINFFYSQEKIRANTPVNLRADSITVAAALTKILNDTDIDVILSGGMQVALIPRAGSGAVAKGSLIGWVTDTATGRRVSGAEVLLEGTRWRTETDTTGRYRLAEIDAGTYTLIVRRLGYRKLSQQVTVSAGQEDTLHLAIAPMTVTLNELITTATGPQRRRDLGNAITTINADSVMRTAPIRSLTDLLENRVPGLTTQHTSGAPGDPSRLRLRGIGSVLRANDPVLIVDGIRVYSAQTEARSGNLTNIGPNISCAGCPSGRTLTSRDVPAPSPLDQIDPNTIEKIEVFKGPSAATFYGADAANGVIVVTTKKGRPGPTSWTAKLVHGRTDTPGEWPLGYYRWGSIPELGGRDDFCSVVNFSCQTDSLVRYQALNDPATTILAQGRRNELSLTASGGNPALTYSVTGSYTDEIGLLQLPNVEVERFRTLFTREAPDWMRRPHQFTTWNVASTVKATLGRNADVLLRATVGRSDQQRSTLERQLDLLAGIYIDPINSIYYIPSATIGGSLTAFNGTGPGASSLVQDFYQRTTASSITFSTSLEGQWQPRPWFNAIATAGVNVIPREDETFLPGGLVGGTTPGALSRASGRSLLSTMNLRGSFRKRLGLGFNFITNVGTNIQTTTINDIVVAAGNIAPGVTTITGATGVGTSSGTIAIESRSSTSVFGWYIEPQVIGQRFAFSTGIRLDGGNTYGTRISGGGGLGNLLSLPRLNGSWVISEEPWFPFSSLFSSLRLRAAYGQAQVQPGLVDRLRIYTSPGSVVKYKLTSVGNTELRPERSVELEGGFEADLLDSRVSLAFTTYRKTQVDAHMPVALPPSVNGGGSNIQNLGDIRNSGIELSLDVTPVRTSMVTWSTGLTYARNTNTLVKLGQGVVTDKLKGWVEGYPVGSRWARPILGYADANGNGFLDRNEVRLGDSLVYLGHIQPDYNTVLTTNLALFGGMIGITALVTYESGATQVDETARTNWVLSRALVDPSTPFSEQAAVLAMGGPGDSTEFGLTQDVSTLRYGSVSVNYRAPVWVARWFRAEEMTIGIAGSNLGLHTNYQGKDPNVSAWGAGDVVRDTGQLPIPRTWQLSVNLRY